MTETWDDMRNWVAKKAGTVSSGVSDRLTHNRDTMEVTLGNLARAVRAAGATALNLHAQSTVPDRTWATAALTR